MVGIRVLPNLGARPCTWRRCRCADIPTRRGLSRSSRATTGTSGTTSLPRSSNSSQKISAALREPPPSSPGSAHRSATR